ncbi:MAG: ABC transporter substrate-binding protein [marine bacterium B5-7]|nr:MAG: ABC transporter substrate-binding protein [marine bacterium B5-7]
MKKWLYLFLCCYQLAVAAPLQKINVLLDWAANPNHAALFVAQQQGFFQREGLAVNLTAPADPTDPLKLVAAGQFDIGISYQHSVRLARKQHLPIQVIGNLIDTPLSTVMVLADSPVKKLQDLKGKRIAISGSKPSQHLQTMLAHVGLTLQDVQLIQVHYNIAQALLTRGVDASSDVFRNVEPLELKLKGIKTRLFYPEDYGVKPYPALVIIMHKPLDKRLAEKFMLAVNAGKTYWHAHPKQTWQAFAKTHPALDSPANQAIWVKTAALLVAHKYGFS